MEMSNQGAYCWVICLREANLTEWTRVWITLKLRRIWNDSLTTTDYLYSFYISYIPAAVRDLLGSGSVFFLLQFHSRKRINKNYQPIIVFMSYKHSNFTFFCPLLLCSCPVHHKYRFFLLVLIEVLSFCIMLPKMKWAFRRILFRFWLRWIDISRNRSMHLYSKK